MDVIALAEAGIDHAVAPLGTAITEHQLAALWKLAPEPVVALDGDAAGLAAAQRLIDLALPLLGPDRSLRFALLPPGQDPDDVVRAGGAAAMQAILDASQPIVALLWERETAGQVLDSPERRAALDARLRAHLARIGDAGLRAHWEREIRARRAALFAAAAAAGRAAPAPGRGARPRTPGFLAPAGPTPGTSGSLLAAARSEAAEARVRESAILAGCLNHPDGGAGLRGPAGAARLPLAPTSRRCATPCLSALAGSLDRAASGLRRRSAAPLGRDPLPALAACGAGARQPPPRPGGRRPQRAARAVDEELTRHAALTGRADEIREAAADLAAPPTSLTLRGCAPPPRPSSRPTAGRSRTSRADDESERLEFARVIQLPRQARHAGRENVEPDIANRRFVR